MFKICTKCGADKLPTEFYRGQACCKDCWKAKVKARARSNPSVQAYDRARAKTPARKANAHHDDYAKPLEVRWLCALHHQRHHADTGQEGANKRAGAGAA